MQQLHEATLAQTAIPGSQKLPIAVCPKIGLSTCKSLTMDSKVILKSIISRCCIPILWNMVESKKYWCDSISRISQYFKFTVFTNIILQYFTVSQNEIEIFSVNIFNVFHNNLHEIYQIICVQFFVFCFASVIYLIHFIIYYHKVFRMFFVVFCEFFWIFHNIFEIIFIFTNICKNILQIQKY